MNKLNCPICGAAETELLEFKESHVWNGHACDVELHSRYCTTCTSEFAGVEETRFNKRSMLAFKKRVDDMLSGRSIKGIREKLGLTISQAGAVFGGGPVAFCKYEQNDICQTVAMDKLLRMADEFPDVASALMQRAGIAGPQTKDMSSTETSNSRVKVVDDIDKSDSQYYPKQYRRTHEESTKNVKGV